MRLAGAAVRFRRLRGDLRASSRGFLSVGGFADTVRSSWPGIRRIKQRVADLDARVDAAAEPRPSPRSTAFAWSRMPRRSGWQLFFPGKPDAETREKLKRYGFRWAPSVGAWQRQLNNGARYAAERVLGKAPERPALPQGWTEASPGGLATNPDPVTGGIVDRQIVSGLWFVISHDGGIGTLEGFATRADAFAALQARLSE